MNTYKESSVEIEQIKELIEHLEKSKLKKIHLKKGDFELQLEKEDSALAALSPHYHPSRSAVSEITAETIFHSPTTEGRKEEGLFVTSPLVGTFFASPAPDQPSFVKVGDRVTPDTVVCVVEAMKVMNEVKANMNGTVVEILVENAHPVEFGTKIFRIESCKKS
jgi:acetyl-CoA carboxylase biotin carboxyl carrier protein